MKNELKDVTSDEIQKLNDAGVRVLMATGDNLQTGMSVGRDCNILKQN